MAAAHAMMHTRNDSGVSVHSFVVHENPPSPTLTNPDMIVPIPPWGNNSSFDDDDDQAPHPLLEPEIPLHASTSNSSLSRASATSAEEVAIATTLLVPQRLSVPPPTSISGPTTPIPTYTGYEHGAPLSDIYEESEATPKSAGFRSRSASPTPVPEQPPTPTRPQLRHKKRISELSTSSGGSDVGDWENFDSSKVLTSRVAADLAQMKRDDMLDVEEQVSRRQSREEEELAALNAKAEKILANARKRLTHMEDNLKTARTSVLAPRSPQIGDAHQPVGGLYRSISAAGASKLAKQRQGYPSVRTSTSLQHMRGNSETGVPSQSSRQSRTPDVRSASAMEYGSPARYTLFPDSVPSSGPKYIPSPASNKSYNSPLRPLEEEDHSPSTAKTTPESVKVPPMRGLGILTSAALSRENLAMHAERSSSRQNSTTPTAGFRPSSAASTRSARDLKDQMTDLKTRIADLRSKAQADNFRRRSLQSARGSSPFANASNQPEQWYTSSPTYENASPVSSRSGIGWRNSNSPTEPQVASHDAVKSGDPITPANARFLDATHLTPGAEAHILSSARTDRNTPSLAKKREAQDDNADSDDDAVSVVQASQYDDARADIGVLDEDNDSDRIAENEEEQIYLNEVLEESLRDAEVEPEVPMIPGSFLPSPDGMHMGPEPERHEDRLDAFDYENMFLHSAMGTYTGKSINGSDSGSDADSDDDGSVETSRAGGRTPIDESEPDTEPPTDEEMEQIAGESKSPKHSTLSTRSEQPTAQPAQLRTPPQIDLPLPPPPALGHARSKSMESISTAATFETATEGGNYDETPNEILNWDPTPSSSIGYSPTSTSYQAYRNSETRSPARHRHGFSSPQGGGRSTPTAPRQIAQSLNSPLRQQFVATEAINYINDNGVPERFQNQPSPHYLSYKAAHSRDNSAASMEHNLRPSSQATIKYVSPIRAITPATPNSRAPRDSTDGQSPIAVSNRPSPQRKTVINRSLQYPESYIAEPYYAPPPSAPLPAPPTLPSSAALQAQMASPRKSALKQPSAGPVRVPSQKKSSPIQSSQRTPPIQDPPSSPPSALASAPSNSAPTPNTEILMESLIKLANPSFCLAPGIRFNEVDKGLVLDLLGAVGGVCNEILTAGARRGDPEENVERLRRRLEGANHVLLGVRDAPSRERTMREI